MTAARVGKATPAFGMQVGFYYKTFMRPRWAWKYYERFLRSAAGLGKLDPEHRRDRRYEKVHRHVDVLVIGGGESGLEAAVASAREGNDTVLVDEGLALGGRLAFSGIAAATRAAELGGAAREAGVEILQPAWAGGVYEGNLVPVYQGDTMYRFRAGEIVLATGRDRAAARLRRERPARRDARLRRAPAGEPVPDRPGDEAVVVTVDDLGIEAACDLAEAGVAVAAVVDTREGDAGRAPRRVRHRAPARVHPVEARGSQPRHRRRRRPRRGAAAPAGRPRRR